MRQARELLRAKRAGEVWTPAEIGFLVQGMAEGTLGDEQLGAFAMAVALQGMGEDERVALTLAMRDSGRVMRWAGLDGPVLDKHSTGGIGDSTSLLIGPWVAACGGFVPMITGRGLGHTGGTCDKLESIPGYTTAPDPARFESIVRELGVAIIGQTRDLAPADRRLYGVRDVTGTVDCLALIVASILGKKLAEGLDGLVLDVKYGNGAVMQDLDAAAELARTLAATATSAGTPTRALLTDMNQSLGRCAGNALEIREIIDLLTGRIEGGRLFELSRRLSAELLLIGQLAEDDNQALDRLDAAWARGEVAERFARMVSALGGPVDLIERPEEHLVAAPVEADVFPARPGIVQSIDVRGLGLAVIDLGGGRHQASDPIDGRVGLSELAGIGDRVDAERPLMRVHARSENELEGVTTALRDCFILGDDERLPPPLTHVL
jgi:thymidine phosphorylase